MVDENQTQVSKSKSRPIWQWLVLLAVLVAIGLLGFKQRVNAPQSASIKASGIQQAKSGHIVTVPIEIDTAGQTINTAEVYLKFDPRTVQVQSVSKDNSIFTIWIPGQPAFDNTKGEVSFGAGLPTPGFKGKGKIGTVTLVSQNPLNTRLTFDSRTQALLNDGQGTALPLKLAPIEAQIK